MTVYTEEQNKAWRETLPKKRIAVKVIAHDQDGKYLLVKPNYREYWHIPGGGVDRGESPLSGAIREFKEESGLTVSEHELRLVDVVHFEMVDQLNVIYELTNVIDADKIIIQESEIDEFKMVAPDEVGGYLSERMSSWWEDFLSKISRGR